MCSTVELVGRIGSTIEMYVMPSQSDLNTLGLSLLGAFYLVASSAKYLAIARVPLGAQSVRSSFGLMN